MKMNFSTADIAKGVRKDWGSMCPITKRINSKKVYVRKNKWNNSYCD